MPRNFGGGQDRVWWAPIQQINAQQFTPFTITFWANNWLTNAINDRFLFNKADQNHQKGQFSIFCGAFDPAQSTNNTLAFWNGSWDITEGQWTVLAPADNNWHFATIRYSPGSVTEKPEISLDTVVGSLLGDIGHQPAGNYLVEVNDPGGGNSASIDHGNYNPQPFPLEIGATVNANLTGGGQGWVGDLWRFSWWDDILSKQEIRELYNGKPPTLTRSDHLMFHCELDGNRFGERDEGRWNMGFANISGTQKSLSAPFPYYTPKVYSFGLKRNVRRKGFSPTGNVSIAGMGMSSGQGSVLAATAQPIQGLQLNTTIGTLKGAAPAPPLTGQTMASQQGNMGSFVAPKIVLISGQSLASAAGSVSLEVSPPLAGQQMTAAQGGLGTGRTAIINLPGMGMSVSQGSVVGGSGPRIEGIGMQAAQGQLYIDAQTEYVRQSWIKIEGPP